MNQSLLFFVTKRRRYTLELYRCYNEQLTQYLQSSGFRFLMKAYDIVTHRKMWIFENTLELKQSIKQWEKMSPRK